MRTKIILTIFILILIICTNSWACSNSLTCKNASKSSETKTICNDVKDPNVILKKLNQNTLTLKSYQCRIEYLFNQPLFESKTLRKGDLYYKKSNGKTKLRINFNTLKQDDEKEKQYKDQYIFDGIWLTHIDYPNKHVQMRQLAEPNNPANVFDLLQENFPLIGFTNAEDLKNHFEITLTKLIRKKPESQIKMHLKTKPDSTFNEDYTAIDFWIDRKLYLPKEIVAFTSQDDVYQIKFTAPKVNQKIKENVFDFQIPAGFDKPEIILLEKKNITK